MVPFAGITVLVVMLFIGLFITTATIIGYAISYKHAKQKGERIKLWEKILLWTFLVLGVSVVSFPTLFFYTLISSNIKQSEQTVIKEQQTMEEADDYDEQINTMEVFLGKDNMTGFRLIATDSAAGSKYYELEKTTDGGSSWVVINEDPLRGKLGQAEGIEFFTETNGYIGITDASGTYSQIYVTYDGGSTFSRIEFPMELVEILPENAVDNGYTAYDYDYYEMPTMNHGNLEINAVTDSSDTNGITFVSEDNGKSWKAE